MRFLAVALAVFCLASVGCRSQQTPVASSARTAIATGSPLAPASSGLDAEVAMPPGFPSDFPVYPHARLTAAASFSSTGQVAWGLEWQSLDATSKVQAQYPKQFSAGDWALESTSNPEYAYSATISRKSDTHVTGTVAIANDASVTRILVSLVSTG